MESGQVGVVCSEGGRGGGMQGRGAGATQEGRGGGRMSEWGSGHRGVLQGGGGVKVEASVRKQREGGEMKTC